MPVRSCTPVGPVPLVQDWFSLEPSPPLPGVHASRNWATSQFKPSEHPQRGFLCCKFPTSDFNTLLIESWQRKKTSATDCTLLRESIPWDPVCQVLVCLVSDFAGVSEGSLQLQLGLRCFVELLQLFLYHLVCIQITSLRSISQLHFHLFLWHLLSLRPARTGSLTRLVDATFHRTWCSFPDYRRFSVAPTTHPLLWQLCILL